jgi:hypothetical protein
VGDLDLLVPAYMHPLEDPAAWDRLVVLAPVLRAVVVNIHNGPGERPDPAYPKVLERLVDAGVRIVGYVDSDYGRRAPARIIADVECWLSRYGVHGVFLDQVASGLDLLDHYADLTVAARSRGADYVVLNPGTTPHPGYVDLANVTVTFEGPWTDYRRLKEPDWVEAVPASRFAHLVHGLPDVSTLPAPLRLAARRHVGTVYVTTGTGANPWDRVPQALPGLFGLADA